MCCGHFSDYLTKYLWLLQVCPMCSAEVSTSGNKEAEVSASGNKEAWPTLIWPFSALEGNNYQHQCSICIVEAKAEKRIRTWKDIVFQTKKNMQGGQEIFNPRFTLFLLALLTELSLPCRNALCSLGTPCGCSMIHKCTDYIYILFSHSFYWSHDHRVYLLVKCWWHYCLWHFEWSRTSWHFEYEYVM